MYVYFPYKAWGECLGFTIAEQSASSLKSFDYEYTVSIIGTIGALTLNIF